MGHLGIDSGLETSIHRADPHLSHRPLPPTPLFTTGPVHTLPPDGLCRGAWPRRRRDPAAAAAVVLLRDGGLRRPRAALVGPRRAAVLRALPRAAGGPALPAAHKEASPSSCPSTPSTPSTPFRTPSPSSPAAHAWMHPVLDPHRLTSVHTFSHRLTSVYTFSRPPTRRPVLDPRESMRRGVEGGRPFSRLPARPLPPLPARPHSSTGLSTPWSRTGPCWSSASWPGCTASRGRAPTCTVSSSTSSSSTWGEATPAVRPNLHLFAPRFHTIFNHCPHPCPHQCSHLFPPR